MTQKNTPPTIWTWFKQRSQMHRQRQCVLPSFQACVYGIPFTQRKEMLHVAMLLLFLFCFFKVFNDLCFWDNSQSPIVRIH